ILLFLAGGVAYLYGYRFQDIRLNWIIGSSVLLIYASFWTGYSDGYRVLNIVEAVYSIHLKDEDYDRHYVPIRTLSSGLLVYDRAVSRVIYFKWDQIISVATRATPPKSDSLICTMMAWGTCASVLPLP